MALDGIRDTQLDALLALLRDGVNAELSVDIDQAIESTHAWPADRPRIPVQRLPALIVWRQRSTFLPRATGPHDQRVTLRMTYLLPMTPIDRAEARWALLHRVWELVVCIALAGHHEAHEGDDAVLTAAGFIDLDIGGATVDFAMPAVDEDVAPRWDATVTVTLRTEADTDDLPLVSLSSELHPESLPADERPLVAEILD